RERTDECDPQQRRVSVIINTLAQVLVDLAASGARVSDQPELGAIGIRRLAADQQAVEEDSGGTQGVGQRRGKRRHAPRVQNVDVRLGGAKQAGIDGEKEPAWLE